jgi:hypothetical protein
MSIKLCDMYVTLLGSYRQISNETTTIARQQLCKYAAVPKPSLGEVRKEELKKCFKVCFVCSHCRGYIMRCSCDYDSSSG